MAVPKIHTEYDPPKSAGIDCSGEPSLTKQSFREECDINVVLDRYGAGPANGAGTPAMFGDFARVPDYLEAQSILLDASSRFASLPAKVRDRFRNSPEEFLAFVGDAKNQDEAVALGLAVAPPGPVAPVKVEVVSPPVAPGTVVPPPVK